MQHVKGYTHTPCHLCEATQCMCYWNCIETCEILPWKDKSKLIMSQVFLWVIALLQVCWVWEHRRKNDHIYGLIIIIMTWILTARCEHFKMWKVNKLTMLLSFNLNSCVWLSLLGKIRFINCYVFVQSFWFF